MLLHHAITAMQRDQHNTQKALSRKAPTLGQLGLGAGNTSSNTDSKAVFESKNFKTPSGSMIAFQEPSSPPPLPKPPQTPRPFDTSKPTPGVHAFPRPTRDVKQSEVAEWEGN